LERRDTKGRIAGLPKIIDSASLDEDATAGARLLDRVARRGAALRRDVEDIAARAAIERGAAVALEGIVPRAADERVTENACARRDEITGGRAADDRVGEVVSVERSAAGAGVDELVDVGDTRAMTQRVGEGKVVDARENRTRLTLHQRRSAAHGGGDRVAVPAQDERVVRAASHERRSTIADESIRRSAKDGGGSQQGGAAGSRAQVIIVPQRYETVLACAAVERGGVPRCHEDIA
jgi:hypothetical protein